MALTAKGDSVGSKDMLDVLLETADGAFAFGESGSILRWNDAAERITGWKAADVLGKRCYEVMNGRDAARNLVCWPDCMVQAMARKGERPFSFDMVATCRNGKRICLNVSTILLRDDKGRYCAGIHLFRDVTGSRRSERGFQNPRNAEDGEDRFQRLTAREREILGLIASGLSPHAIAHQLSISRATLRNHTQRILDKLEVHSKVAAVALAYRHGHLG